jgi:hypothetical protein
MTITSKGPFLSNSEAALRAEFEELKKASPAQVSVMAIVLAVKFLYENGVGTKTILVTKLERMFEMEFVGLDPRIVALEMRNLIEECPEAFVDRAKDGDHYNRDLLCNYAEAVTREGGPISDWLVEFLIWAARDGTEARRNGCQRAGRAYDNLMRDFTIGATVRRVVEVTGLKADRNVATADASHDYSFMNESGCSIVAKALGLLGVQLSKKVKTLSPDEVIDRLGSHDDVEYADDDDANNNEQAVQKIWYSTKRGTALRPIRHRVADADE